MPILSIVSDPKSLTLTAIGEYPVPVARLWAAWVDPRQLERFWGPPEWPASFVEHSLVVGQRSRYFMTGPNGETARGYWTIERVEPERLIAVRDGFADDQWNADTTMPETRMELRFEPTATGSRFTSVSKFPNLEALEKLVGMGMLEGMRAAMGQLDDVLADLRAHSKELHTNLEIVDDTHVRIRRLVRGTVDQVWRAHHDASLVGRWCLGPDGWRMPVCEVATGVGATYRYEWENDQGARFGFTGECLAFEAPKRAVTTERMVGTDGPSTVNTLALSPRPGRHTLLELSIEYPSRELRDQVLASGMLEGMESSYARIDAIFSEPRA